MDLAEHIGFASYKLPSFFELVAQENMLQHAQPAIDYLAKVLAGRFPRRCQWMLRMTDELYLLLSLALNRSTLWNASSSISESYYSLVRVANTSKNQPNSRLSSRMKWLSLAVLVFLPYLQLKLKRLLAQDDTQFSPRMLRAVRALRLIAPYLSVAWQGTDIVLKILYLFEKTRIFSTSLLIAGVHLERVPEKPSDEFTENINGASAESQPESVVRRVLNSILAAAPGSVNTTLFFMTFVEWWYSSEQGKAQDHLPAPPPPAEVPPFASSDARDRPNAALCPICKQPRTIPTALASSGYVFCYRCIHAHVAEHQICPVTHIPSSLDQLIRLYVSAT